MAQYRSISDLTDSFFTFWCAAESADIKVRRQRKSPAKKESFPRRVICTNVEAMQERFLAWFKGRILPTALHENTCDSFVGLVFWVILIHHNTTYSLFGGLLSCRYHHSCYCGDCFRFIFQIQLGKDGSLYFSLTRSLA